MRRKASNIMKRFSKKIVFLGTFLAIVLFTLKPLEVRSQIFLDDEDLNSNRSSSIGSFWLVVPLEGTDADQFVPLGDAILLLGGLGVAYGLYKKKKPKQ